MTPAGLEFETQELFAYYLVGNLSSLWTSGGWDGKDLHVMRRGSGRGEPRY